MFQYTSNGFSKTHVILATDMAKIILKVSHSNVGSVSSSDYKIYIFR